MRKKWIQINCMLCCSTIPYHKNKTHDLGCILCINEFYFASIIDPTSHFWPFRAISGAAWGKIHPRTACRTWSSLSSCSRGNAYNEIMWKALQRLSCLQLLTWYAQSTIACAQNPRRTPRTRVASCPRASSYDSSTSVSSGTFQLNIN